MEASSASDPAAGSIRRAEAVLACAELQPTLAFFVERLGFRLERISPADDPQSAALSGHGLRLLLRRASDEPAGTLLLACDDPDALGRGLRQLVAPNGTRIELVEAEPALQVPAGRQELVVHRSGEPGDDEGWVTGRAGMRYRDLIPGRLGGRFVASRIRIEDAGEVPDHVHFHQVRFQMIHCARGWVRLVYEDQGEPFVLGAGDGVLQPPRIRHRVLECSAGLEVIELACPAEHDTFLDHELALPTAVVRPERGFGGQRFVRYRAEGAAWRPWRLAGFECRDTGFAAATAGLADAQVVRGASAGPAVGGWSHEGELCFAAVLQGTLLVEGPTPAPLRLGPGDALTLPAGLECALGAATDDLELLEVRLPAAPRATSGRAEGPAPRHQ